MLKQTLGSTSLSATTREQLSYELGAILTHQLKDVAAACAHWKIHRRQHPASRYAAEVESAQARLGCQGD
jgi:transmembrane sensor